MEKSSFVEKEDQIAKQEQDSKHEVNARPEHGEIHKGHVQQMCRTTKA